MKRAIALILAAAATSAAAAGFSGCGDASVLYELSEDGKYYIVSGVSGYKRALSAYEILPVYDDGENGEKPVREIGEEAFEFCTSLRSITIPESIQVIGDRAFAYSGISSLEIPESVTTIGYAAFGYCEALYEITVPSSVTDLGAYAFAYCSSLETATIEATIEDLQTGTLRGIAVSESTGTYTNTRLSQISLPATLKYIHKDAFSDNYLEDIYFAGTADEWLAIEVYYYGTQENEDGEEETVTVYYSEEEKIEYYSVDGLTIHCSDYDLVYSGGEVTRTPAE